MATAQTPRDTILDILRTTAQCELDELVALCSEFTWRDVFLEIEKLSRSGEVCITRHGLSGYRVILLHCELPKPTSEQHASPAG